MVSRREGVHKNGFWILEALDIWGREMGGRLTRTKEKGKERKENWEKLPRAVVRGADAGSDRLCPCSYSSTHELYICFH